MKKTTTRLATTAAVLIMSVFAIVLAHHDARKRNANEDDLPLLSVGGLPPTPLAIDGQWTQPSPVVRANNASYPQSSSEVGEPANNPLREFPAGEALAEYELTDTQSNWDESVVTVAGEQTTALAGSTDGPPALGSTASGSQPVAKLDSPLPSGSSASSTLLPLPKFPEQSSAGSLPGAFPGAPSSQSTFAAPQPAPPASALKGLTNLPTGSGQPAQFGSPTSPPPASQFPSAPQMNQPAVNKPPSWAENQSRSEAQPGNRPGTIPTTDLTRGSAPPDWMSNGANRPMETYPAQAPKNEFPPAAMPATEFPQKMTAASVPSTVGPRTSLVSNQPGSRYLDGSQNPVVHIQKRAPEEIQVGKRATFVITVRNAGNAAAHEVTVVDRVPRGSRFAESSPSANPTNDGTLTWNLGEMAAGDERTISLQIVPEVEGEVGSVASVHFVAQASVRTVATSPQVELQIDSAGPVIIGQSQQVTVSIKNSGSGVARGIRLEADIPSQLRHESGEAQLEAFIGDLRPNESRRLTLSMAAVQPGQSQSQLRAVNDDGIQAEQTITVDVRAPQLAATISGPALRYLERQATYQVKISNSGSAMARNLDFVIHLPVGLKYVSTDIAQATYNPQSHSISLGLAELDSGQSAPFSISVLPVQLGPQVIRVNATGDLNLTAEAKAQVTVAGLAELTFSIGQDNGTVEVGATTTYAVQVTNVGNQPDKNVQLQVQLPEGTKLLQVDAPVDYRVEPGRIVFAPVAEMRNRDVKTFRFQIQHDRAGNQVVRSQLTSENWPVAVVKEEGTLVYNDQN